MNDAINIPWISMNNLELEEDNLNQSEHLLNIWHSHSGKNCRWAVFTMHKYQDPKFDVEKRPSLFIFAYTFTNHPFS